LVVSVKVSSTTERPKMVRDRRAMTSGVLFSARSMGTVTRFSTSSAAKPG
jgi:hypothetical protein